MYKLTCHKIGTTKTASVESSHPQALLDHLHAAAERADKGFEITIHLPSHEYAEGVMSGDIERGGQIIGYWVIDEMRRAA